MNILNWLDLAVHLYWRVQVTSKVAASGLLHWISQTGCHEYWTGFGLAPALLLSGLPRHCHCMVTSHYCGCLRSYKAKG